MAHTCTHRCSCEFRSEKGTLQLHLGGSHPMMEVLAALLTTYVVSVGQRSLLPHMELTVEFGGVRQKFRLSTGIDSNYISAGEEPVLDTKWKAIDDPEPV